MVDRARRRTFGHKPREEQNMRYRNYGLLAVGLAVAFFMAPAPVMAADERKIPISGRRLAATTSLRALAR
jgi:hypothetical protein